MAAVHDYEAFIGIEHVHWCPARNRGILLDFKLARGSLFVFSWGLVDADATEGVVARPPVELLLVNVLLR